MPIYTATRPAGDSWDDGTPVGYLWEMIERWLALDWRAVERRVNALPQFRTEVDGQTVHFAHVRSAEPAATPLLLVHSYPGSFLDFLDMIDFPVDPVAHGGRAEDAFHLVILSIPGFGCSTPLAGDADWTMDRVAGTFDTLRRRLGHDACGAHGSDAGALVSRELAVRNPPGFRGAHVLQLFSFPSGDPAEFAAFTERDHAALEFLGWFQSVGGYNQMNGIRPETIAAALADSPVGQLAHSELFESFGNGTSRVTADQLLAQVSPYWLTNSAATAVRYHFTEGRSGRAPVVSHGRIGVAVFADDFQTIRPLAERDNTRIEHWPQVPAGGHYAALDVPQVLVGDLRAFFAGG